MLWWVYENAINAADPWKHSEGRSCGPNRENTSKIMWILENAKLLRYWNVKNIGPYGESPFNFDDFRSFGPWRSPVVKQFGQVEEVCGYITNR